MMMSKSRKAVAALTKKVSENAELVDVIETEKEKLEATVFENKLEINELEKKDVELEAEMKSLKEEVSSLTDPVTMILSSISKVESTVVELESILNQTVPKLYFNVAGIDKALRSVSAKVEVEAESLALLLSRLEIAEKAIAELLTNPKGKRRAKKV